MGDGHRKLKLLYLVKMLIEETDDEHGLTMSQITSGLARQGIPAERKAVYRDLDALREFGLDIETYRRHPREYALANRPFEFPELLLLVDAVQSSRFLTESKSDDLVDRIKSFASHHQERLLSKRVHVEGRIKMQNESVFYNVDHIQEAIMDRKKIEFQYLEYDVNKRTTLRHQGDFYVETPVYLVYSDGYYYLVVFNDAHDDFARYRVDRMVNIRVSRERATRNERITQFDVRKFETRSFGMFAGEQTPVVLAVRQEAMGAVIDRFGKDVFAVAQDDDTALVHVVVLKSPVFYGWLAQFGDLVRVVKPQSLIDDYHDHLRRIVDSYRSDGRAGEGERE